MTAARLAAVADPKRCWRFTNLKGGAASITPLRFIPAPQPTLPQEG